MTMSAGIGHVDFPSLHAGHHIVDRAVGHVRAGLQIPGVMPLTHLHAGRKDVDFERNAAAVRAIDFRGADEAPGLDRVRRNGLHLRHGPVRRQLDHRRSAFACRNSQHGAVKALDRPANECGSRRGGRSGRGIRGEACRGNDGQAHRCDGGGEQTSRHRDPPI